MLMDYGPPYTKMESGITLLDECALPEPSLFEIHSMLNQRLNPNYRDPEDYYNSAMHWCARHSHYRPMKLLRHAKADINPKNEFGHTPLHVISMMVFPEDKRKRQLKTFKYMLEQGAEINIRDKGGYCPIDYAAMNGHEAMVAMLLERGAEVLRENYIFAAGRQPLLHIAVGPVSRAMIRDRIDEVVVENALAVQIAQEEKAIADDIVKLRKRHQRIARKRVEAIEDKQQQLEDEYKKKREDDKIKKLEEDARLLKIERDNKTIHRFGNWKKPDNLGGRWQFETSDKPIAKSNIQIINGKEVEEKYIGYTDNLKTMRKLKDKYDFKKYNDRWKEKTGNNLEIDWKKDEIFKVAEFDSSDAKINSIKNKKNANEFIDSLAIYDENDKELEGENIDDLLQYV